MVSECLDLPASRSMSPGLGGLAESLCRFSLFLRLLTLAEVQGEARDVSLDPRVECVEWAQGAPLQTGGVSEWQRFLVSSWGNSLSRRSPGLLGD